MEQIIKTLSIFAHLEVVIGKTGNESADEL
jgi:hypothetical protein